MSNTHEKMTTAIRDALLTRAINDHGGHLSGHLATAAMSAIGIDQALSCGYETPRVSKDKEKPDVIIDEFCGTPNEARALVGAVLVACNEADLRWP